MEAYNGPKMCPLNRMIGQVKYRDGAHLPNRVVSAAMAHGRVQVAWLCREGAAEPAAGMAAAAMPSAGWRTMHRDGVREGND